MARRAGGQPAGACRTIWRCWSGYHRRSLVETRMRCFRRLGPSASWRFAGRLGPVAPSGSPLTGRSPNCRSGRSRVLSNQWRSAAHPEPLHRPRNAANSARGMSLPKGRRNPASGRIVQQSLLDAKAIFAEPFRRQHDEDAIKPLDSRPVRQFFGYAVY